MTQETEPNRLNKTPEGDLVRASGWQEVVSQAAHAVAEPAAWAAGAKVTMDAVKVGVQKGAEVLQTKMTTDAQIKVAQIQADAQIQTAQIQSGQSGTE